MSALAPTMAPPPRPDVMPPTEAADGDQMPGGGIRHLPQQIEAALLELRQKFEGSIDGNRARREYVKKCLKLLEFFRGNQYTWWDWTTGSWRSTSSSTGGQLANSSAETSQSLYVINIFQAYLLSLVALLTGNKMQLRAFPEDPNNPDDVYAAEKATAVVKEFQRFERPFDQLRREVFSLGICGTYASYIRTVTDGDRWGYVEEPQTEMQDTLLGEPHVVCPVCGDDLNPVPTPGIPARCQLCGAPLPENATPPPATPMPVKTGTSQVPRARTVRSIVDGFELKLPFDAAEQCEFEMIVRSREVAKSVARATWPEIEDRMSPGETGSAGTSSGNDYERRARRQSNLGTTTENRTTVTDDRDRQTLTEGWYRPRAFYNVDDKKIRQALLQAFPKGVKVTWCDDVFCEAREEEMDKVWAVCHALPGRSQVREPILGSLIPIQEAINDIFNIIRDTVEYTLPVTFISTRLLDVKKWARSQVMAGATYNVTDIGKPISEGFHQTDPGRLPEGATALLDKMWTELAQFVTGLFPAAFGGQTPGNNTAQGMEIQRQSALGRINLFLQALQEHYVAIAPLIVEQFKQNAIEPISFVDENEGGEMALTTISPDDFAVGRYRPQFEVVSEYPTTWAQRQALLLQMFQMPALQPWVSLLKNVSKVKSTLGLEIDAPQHSAYQREWRLIKKILAETPQPGPQQPVMQPAVDPATGQPAVDPATGQPGMQPVMDPMTGQPQMQPGPPVCSVPVSPLDDNATMFQALQDFNDSVDGQRALAKAGDGWQNLMLHVQERQAAMAPPPGAAPPPPNATPGAPPAAPPM